VSASAAARHDQPAGAYSACLLPSQPLAVKVLRRPVESALYLRVYMANLRRKLDDPSAPSVIVTEPGMGYRFVANEPAEREEARRP
jgi:Transcriptional regulatory protein, C terminal